jgi:hypothetical protein
MEAFVEHPGEIGRPEARSVIEDCVKELGPDHSAIVGRKMHQTGSRRPASTEVREQSVEFLIAEQGEVEGQGVLVEGKPSDQGSGIAAEKLFSWEVARIRGDTGGRIERRAIAHGGLVKWLKKANRDLRASSNKYKMYLPPVALP